MLELEVDELLVYDEVSEEFVQHNAVHLVLEHSLISLTKWEAKWKKPWISADKKTDAEIRGYVECMSIRPVGPEVVERLTPGQLSQVVEYMNDSHSATTFSADNRRRSSKIVTSEVIYGWMVSLQIPFECEKWHLNRLFTLVRVVNQASSPGPKIPRNEVLASNRALNQARRAEMGTKG